MENKNKELETLLKNAKNIDWSYDILQEPEEIINGHHYDERNYIEIGKYSPAGEDFSMIINFSKENPVNSFLENLREYIESFDVDEHVEMWLPERGKGGCPGSISELLEDATAIQNMMTELLETLQNCL